MKKILSLQLCVILLCSLISCNSPANNPDTTDQPKEDLFLISIPQSDLSLMENNKTFQLAADYGIGGSPSTIILKELENTIKDPFNNGKKFTYTQSEQYLNSANQCESFYAQFDTYTNGDEKVVYLSGSNIITFYSGGGGTANGNQTLSEDALKQIADDFLAECISEESLSKYTYAGMNPNLYGMTTLTYKRYVEGYKTEDNLTVFFNDDGSIKGYNGKKACKFDNISTPITKQNIDAASEKLLSKIKELQLPDLTYGDPVLITNTSGEVFVEIWIRYTNTELSTTTTDSLYVRVD